MLEKTFFKDQNVKMSQKERKKIVFYILFTYSKGNKNKAFD